MTQVEPRNLQSHISNLHESWLEYYSRFLLRREVLTFSYEGWFPILPVYDNGSFDGILPRVMEAVGKKYNLTIEFQRVRDPSGGRLDNGTWTGDLGDVQQGVIDGSLWGWVPTINRSEAVDFTTAIVPFHFGLVISRSTQSRVSFRNYTGQFQPQTWMVIFLMSIFLLSLLMLLLKCDKTLRFNLSHLMLSSLGLFLRMLINKVPKCGIYFELDLWRYFYFSAFICQSWIIIPKMRIVYSVCGWHVHADCLPSHF